MSVSLSSPVNFVDEVADFLASQPSREELLAYRASESAEERLQELLAKQRDSELTHEESLDLAQFQQTEILLRLIKARLRPPSPQPCGLYPSA